MKLLVMDTADVVMKRKSDGHVFITAEAQLTSISQSLGINEKIYGGIGNKPLAIMKGQKEVTSTLRNAFYDLEFLSMTQGVAIDENGTATVYKTEKELTVVDNAGTLEVTITGTPVNNTVYVRNAAGEIEQATATSGKVTIPTGHADAGEIVSVTYQEEVTGNIVELEAEKFAEAYTLEYHTIAYDPATNKVVKDIYIQLDHVVPTGEFELSLENGTAIAPEINFECLAAPGTNKIGRVIEVDRA
jgi:archaellum component FlaG (FlaF/FlaG flagellin family)